MLLLVKLIKKEIGKWYQEKTGYLLQYKLYKLRKMKPDCKDLKNEYKNYFKLLDEVIKDAQFKFERKKIKESKTKKANKTINYIYANKKNHCQLIGT